MKKLLNNLRKKTLKFQNNLFFIKLNIVNFIITYSLIFNHKLFFILENVIFFTLTFFLFSNKSNTSDKINLILSDIPDETPISNINSKILYDIVFVLAAEDSYHSSPIIAKEHNFKSIIIDEFLIYENNKTIFDLKNRLNLLGFNIKPYNTAKYLINFFK